MASFQNLLAAVVAAIARQDGELRGCVVALLRRSLSGKKRTEREREKRTLQSKEHRSSTLFLLFSQPQPKRPKLLQALPTAASSTLETRRRSPPSAKLQVDSSNGTPHPRSLLRSPLPAPLLPRTSGETPSRAASPRSLPPPPVDPARPSMLLGTR